MTIRLHNTKSGEKEVFVPLQEKTVGMYHCGPTVYGYAHIGNMRTYITADTIRRLFSAYDYTINQVINVTDVGHLTSDADDGADKIEEAAKKSTTSVKDIVKKYENAFHADLHTLHIQTEGTHFPRATDHINEQIDMIATLEKKGHTYTTDDGVYFDTSTFPAYGALGHIDIEGLEAGARVALKQKRNPTDFALWKFSPTGEKRLQEWPSPWGIGFPGWHIECSAMSTKYLGETFDIHTGGIDHIPVHHNNEIAQTECATGKPYVHYWLHNAFATWEGQKMSKSLGNILTVSDLKEKNINPLALKLVYLQSHYRSPIALSLESLGAAHSTLNKIYVEVYSALQYMVYEKMAQGATLADAYAECTKAVADIQKNIDSKTNTYFLSYRDILSDNLNTSGIISSFFENRNTDHAQYIERALALDALLGLNIASFAILPPLSITEKSMSRHTMRQEKNFTDADTLRTELVDLGYASLDGNQTIVIPKELVVA